MLLRECFCFALFLFWSTGSRALPEAWSSRSVLSAWWLTCIILTTAYSANMAAHFSVAKQRPLFRSLEDLVGQSEYRWGLLQNASIYLTMLKVSHVTLKVNQVTLKVNHVTVGITVL